MARLAAGTLTFTAVVVAWVFFRSVNVDGAVNMLASMSGLRGVALPMRLRALFPESMIAALGELGVRFGSTGEAFSGATQVVWILIPLLGCWLLPNTQEILRASRPILEPVAAPRSWVHIDWRPSLGWALAIALLASASLLSLNRVSEFLYFQF